jgi:exosortase D (VPLPA-CTERM-specific)
MSESIAGDKPWVWRLSSQFWIFIATIAALLGMTFYVGIREMVLVWNTREESSYGYLIPFITLFLMWQKKNTLEKIEFKGSWPGVMILVLGLIFFYLGSLSTITTVIQYALIIVIVGVAISIMGWVGLKPILVPLLFLLFMIPLPGFFLNNLSAQLQLISSSLGVEVTRLFGVSVHLEGNVVDLGTFKLQVVDACSGLRYLFPLMSLSFICAYMYQGAFWKRALIFLSSVPITIFMNSFRIGVIGILVEYWGVAQAQGFIHDFEGWAIFMACFGIILVEMWILAKVGKDKKALIDVFNLSYPEPLPENADIRRRELPKQYLVVGALVLVAAISSHFLVTQAEIHPQRNDFVAFPLKLGDWQGRRESIEKIVLDQLKLDDYILVDYAKDRTNIINLYVAYYASQKAGESAHSPRSCIPGGGWRIQSISPHAVKGVTVSGAPLTVNRLVIQKGDTRQMVYYWFQQRGRIITNEYMVKWYLFWDALTRNRTDGALIRLTTFIRPNADVTDADKELDKFAGIVVDELKNYIPD